MHERTQRAISRLLFVLCCAVPTAITMMIVIVMATPWYDGRVRRAIQFELARDTGLSVEIGGFTRIAPSTIRIDELRLFEPETMREVAHVRQLEWVDRGDDISIMLRQPELQAATLESAWKLIHDRFLCRPEQTRVPIRFAANDLTIHSLTNPMTLRDVDAWIEPEVNAVRASIECLPATSRGGTPISIKVRRDRGGETPATDWTLDTHENALPCSVLAEYLPDPIGSLGSGATFSGSLRWHLEQGKRGETPWWIDLVGHFNGISLDRVFEKQSHHLSGLADLNLERCRIEPRRRVDLAGTLLASEGKIGRSLLGSVKQNLGFVVRAVEGTEDMAYDRIAIRFALNDTQLTLDGIANNEVGYSSFPAGVVMHANGYPIVGSGAQLLPSITLMSALAPSHSEMVPLSGQNSALMNLMIPPTRPMPQDAEAVRARIRTAKGYSGGPVTGQPY